MRWLVDGMNVIGSRPDGWWIDRRAAMERLAHELSDYASSTGEEVRVVFDGEPFEVLTRIDVAFAAGGPDAADDELVRIAASLPRPEVATVVTSDRRLAQRIRALGANVLGAKAFRDRLDGTSP
jgi:predicted RNA-binding protein with PIN domain